MNFVQTPLSGLLVIEPKVFQDPRGWFFEAYHKARFAEQGITHEWLQDNFSSSAKGTLRGLHYQLEPYAQAKLVKVLKGKVFDVIVDIRKGSPTYGQWFSIELSAENKKMLYIPIGFAHGFCALEEDTQFFYKCSNFYSPEHERTILWNDPALGIQWPIEPDPVFIAEKDKKGVPLREIENTFQF